MDTKMTFNLGPDKPLVMALVAGFVLMAVVTILDFTNTFMPLTSWFGLRGFLGMPFVLVLVYAMDRVPAWINPVPTWLGRVIHVVMAGIVAYLFLALIVMMAVSSAMIWTLV